MEIKQLIDEYLGGAELVRQAVAGMSDKQLTATPVPGKWSTKYVICHISDFEPVYADRMKRVIAEDQPTLFGGDPDVFAARLAYDQRDIHEEIQLIDAVRRHTARILRALPEEDFQRTGNHSEDGPITLLTLLQRITGHVPHHLRFVQEKRQALGL